MPRGLSQDVTGHMKADHTALRSTRLDNHERIPLSLRIRAPPIKIGHDLVRQRAEAQSGPAQASTSPGQKIEARQIGDTNERFGT